jgi:hypothetical protein
MNYHGSPTDKCQCKQRQLELVGSKIKTASGILKEREERCLTFNKIV